MTERDEQGPGEHPASSRPAGPPGGHATGPPTEAVAMPTAAMPTAAMPTATQAPATSAPATAAPATQAHAAQRPPAPAAGSYPAAPTAGVPPRPNPLPPPRPVRPQATTTSSPRPDSRTGQRPGTAPRPVARARKARLVLKRIDPWSVFLYSVVASIFIGIALVVAVGLLYAVMSKLGVLTSVNELIGDVTSEPGTTATPSHFFSVGKVMTFAGLIAALDVVLITMLATLGAFLYNLCASLTGGIEVTLSDQS